MTQVKAHSFMSSATRDTPMTGQQNTHRSSDAIDISPADYNGLTPGQNDVSDFCFETLIDVDQQ